MNAEDKKDQKSKMNQDYYRNKVESEGNEYKSQVDRSLERIGSRTYSIRAKVSTIVSAYDCMDAFGGSTAGRGIGSILISVLDSCMDSLRRDGLIPLRTDEEIAEKFGEITGTSMQPTVSLTAPSFSRNLDIRQISSEIAENIQTEPEESEPEIYTPQSEEFSIGELPVEKPLEDRIFERQDDPLIKEASESNDDGWKDALVRTYKTLPESLWGSDTARTLYNANLSIGNNNG